MALPFLSDSLLPIPGHKAGQELGEAGGSFLIDTDLDGVSSEHDHSPLISLSV